ncbi:862_t:CDS:2 [Entrophospora sp. SA101]|nr:856_t:CDS:2 [Entrophospora sp. SA101]CAJ0627070.1 862_t:CDS:2 [Entrophospora sp. SA101]
MDFDEEDISNGSKNNRNNNSLPPFRNVISRKRTIMNVDDSDEEARIVKSNKIENLDGCKEALKRFHKLAKDTDIDFSSKIGKGRKQRPRSDELQNRLKTCYADGRRTDLDLYQKIWIKRNYPGKNERTEPRIETVTFY